MLSAIQAVKNERSRSELSCIKYFEIQNPLTDPISYAGTLDIHMPFSKKKKS